jgi:ActR/RegA family two-component response regulator
MTNDDGKTLLIVDDDPGVVRALTRSMGRHFGEVLSAASSRGAASILSEKNVTHVICDQKLGDKEPLGLDLVPLWRKDHPAIERAIVMTGLDASTFDAHPAVDAIVSKLTSTGDLARLLGRA